MIYRFLRAYADGGVFGRNPSPRGIYWSVLVEDGEDELALIRKQSPDYHTNADAEWLAIREALQWAADQKVQQPLVVYNDSLPTVLCYNGHQQIHEERHLEIFRECKRLARQLPWVAIELPRKPSPPVDWPHTAPWMPGWRPRTIMVEKLGH